MKEIIEYDSNGKAIHCKINKGCEWWKKYDSNGNEIHTIEIKDGWKTEKIKL